LAAIKTIVNDSILERCRKLAWRGLSAGHGGIRAAIGFNAGADAGVAAPRQRSERRDREQNPA